jgi:RNA polymerase sigma factor (sigma-70 family)
MFWPARPRFLRIAQSILRNDADAEDALQNACLSAYLHLDAFEGRSSLKSWFTRILINATLMYKRKHREILIGPRMGDDEIRWKDSSIDAQSGASVRAGGAPGDDRRYTCQNETCTSPDNYDDLLRRNVDSRSVCRTWYSSLDIQSALVPRQATAFSPAQAQVTATCPEHDASVAIATGMSCRREADAPGFYDPHLQGGHYRLSILIAR